MKRALVVIAMLFVPGALAAQDTPPEELPEGHPPVAEETPPGHPPIAEETPPGHPPVAEEAPGHGPGGPPHGHPAGPDAMGDAAIARMFAPPETATAEPASDVPPGSIRVVVVDEHDQPVADAEIELGIMRSAGDRERVPARSGPDGVYVFSGLETGSGQAYRVNVLHEGATYSSTPFQLPEESGYTSRVRRLPVSHDDQQILQFVAQLLLEIRDDRLHCIYQMQLVNVGDATYVFPADGMRMRLPDGFLAFTTQAVMTDQHWEEQPGYGARLGGSLPPGSVTLMFAFDVPTDGDTLELRVGNPFRTMRYRVISEAPEGLELEVDDFPRTRRVTSDGQILLATELQRRPGDEPLEEVHLSLRGIPGPGPLRWIALAIGLLFLAGGISRFAGRSAAASPISARLAELEKRKEALLLAARQVDQEHAAGEIGDNYRQKRRDAIVSELAGLLYREEQLRASAPRTDGPGKRAASAGAAESKAKSEVSAKKSGASGGAKGKKARADRRPDDTSR